jgi:hypothetical protein
MQSINEQQLQHTRMEHTQSTPDVLAEHNDSVISFPTKAVRYKGVWYQITPKPYESERQTSEIAWRMIKNGEDSKTAYRLWFLSERNKAKLFYPSFRKDDA